MCHRRRWTEGQGRDRRTGEEKTRKQGVRQGRTEGREGGGHSGDRLLTSGTGCGSLHGGPCPVLCGQLMGGDQITGCHGGAWSWEGEPGDPLAGLEGRVSLPIPLLALFLPSPTASTTPSCLGARRPPAKIQVSLTSPQLQVLGTVSSHEMVTGGQQGGSLYPHGHREAPSLTTARAGHTGSGPAPRVTDRVAPSCPSNTVPQRGRRPTGTEASPVPLQKSKQARFG